MKKKGWIFVIIGILVAIGGAIAGIYLALKKIDKELNDLSFQLDDDDIESIDDFKDLEVETEE